MSGIEAREITPNSAVQDLVEARGGSISSYTSYSGGAEMGWSLFLPPYLRTDTPLLTAAGHLGEEFAYYPVALAAMKEGVPTIVTGQAKAQEMRKAIHPAHLFHPERLQAQLICRVIKDLTAIEGIERVNAAGHSKSGGPVLDSADRHPEQFESVAVWGSSGMNKHGIVSLALRTPELGIEAWHERDRLYKNFQPILGEAAMIFAGYVLQNSLRIAGETIAVSRSYNRGKLRSVRKKTPTGAMVFENDGYFKPAEVARKIAGIVDVFKELKGVGHLAPQTHPAEVVEAQLEIIEDFRSNRRAIAA